MCLFYARLLQMRGRSIANCQVNDSARSKPNQHAVLGKLHPVDQLAAPVDNVVNRNGIHILARPDPQIALRIGARGSRRERRLVVRQLTRRDHCERWEWSARASTSGADGRDGRVAAGCHRHRSGLGIW